MTKQQGVGLVELLISLFLSCFLIAIVMQHYLSIKRQYKYSQALLANTYELQLVSDFIQDSVRRAGFTPCLPINLLKTVDRLQAIEIYVGKHHALRFSRMDEHFTTVLKIISPTQLLTSHTQPIDFKYMLLADCYHAEIIRVLKVQHTNNTAIITFDKPLRFHYVEPIYIGGWIVEEFFIQRNKENKLALFYQINHAEELTPLVNNMVVNLESSQGNMLLAVLLELANNKKLMIETKVRAI